MTPIRRGMIGLDEPLGKTLGGAWSSIRPDRGQGKNANCPTARSVVASQVTMTTGSGG